MQKSPATHWGLPQMKKTKTQRRTITRPSSKIHGISTFNKTNRFFFCKLTQAIIQVHVYTMKDILTYQDVL